MSSRRRIRRSRGGGYEVRLAAEERSLLTALSGHLIALLEGVGETPLGDLPDALRRLLPPAYTTDPDAERGYVSMTREDLVEHHRESLETMVVTARATWLDDDQLTAWLAALNDLRLALGSMLGVTEDESEPPLASDRQAELIAYLYLGGLQSEIIDILERTLPDPVPGADDLVPEDPWGEPPAGCAGTARNNRVADERAANGAPSAHDHGLGRDLADDGEGPSPAAREVGAAAGPSGPARHPVRLPGTPREIAGNGSSTYFRESLQATIAVTGLADGPASTDGSAEQGAFADERLVTMVRDRVTSSQDLGARVTR